jgi:K+-transporting ATPase c subunit
VAKAREDLSAEKVRELVRAKHRLCPTSGFWAMPGANVLKLNLALDQLH